MVCESDDDGVNVDMINVKYDSDDDGGIINII